MATDLTIIVIEDAEKDRRMIERFFYGLGVLNAAALSRVQVIAVTQRQDSTLPVVLTEFMAHTGCEVLCVEADHPRADDGYPIWDICDALRQVGPLVQGEYISFAHAEFIYGPDRLERTCRYLRRKRPVLAMGNLRRLGHSQAHWHNRLLSPQTGLTDMIAEWIDADRPRALTAAWDDLPTTHWAHWRDEPRDDGTIDEDIVYVRRDWLATLAFFDQDTRQPYQDVYDLLRAAYAILRGSDLEPFCHRLSRRDNDVIHLDHPRRRPAYSLACYRWFLAHRQQWQGTSHGRDDLWSRILSPSATDDQRHQAISEFRHGSDGTVTRWSIAFVAWLRSGGAERVREYMAARDAADVLEEAVA